MRYEANERCSAGTGETVEGLCSRLGRIARRGRRAGRGQPRRRHRHQPLRRVRQERAHPLRQPGRVARPHLPRAVRRAWPATSTACTTRARSTAPWCSSATGPSSAPSPPASPALSDGARERRRSRPACSRRSARCASPRRRGRRARSAASPAAPGLPGRPRGARAAARAAASARLAPARRGAGLGRAARGRRRPRRAGAGRARRCSASTSAPPARRPRSLDAADRRRAGERLPAHRGQPGRGGAGAGRRGRRDGAEPGGRRRPHRLRPRRRGDRRSAPPSPTSARGSPCRTRSSPTPRRPRALDPDGGRSLSIVEIGGQDAKFINVENGRVVDADMNRVCSAGTGSFLEEQAIAHGVDDIAEFGRLAAASDGPPDLGQTCTVFVADVAAEALGDGFSRDDIFAGLQHSVVRNYRSRVMGQRRLLDRVFFQGKPATDPALARTLAAVLEREVVVPADPGAMGAVGIALLAARARGRRRTAPARRARRRSTCARARAPASPAAASSSAATATASTAATSSSPRSTSPAQREKIVSGGQCPKYDAVSAAGDEAAQGRAQPVPRARRAAARAARRRGGRTGLRPAARPAQPAVSPACSSACPTRTTSIDTLPFFHTLLRRLGYRVEVLRAGPRHAGRGRPALRRAGRLRAGQAAARARRRRRRRASSRRSSCTCRCPTPARRRTPAPWRRARRTWSGARCAPRARRRACCGPSLFEKEGDGFDAPRVRRSIALAHARAGRRQPGARALHARARSTPPTRPPLDAQRRFEAGLHAIGARALAWAREHGYPVVLIAGETHVIHDAVLDAGVHELVAANGAVPLPVDCYPLPRGRAGDAARALGERRPDAARHGRRRRRRRRVPAAARRLRLRPQLDDRAPLRRPRRGLAARRARERRPRRQGRLRDARAGVPAQRAPLARDGGRRRGRGRGAAGGRGPARRRDAAAGRAAAHDATGAGMQARLARFDRRLPHSLDAGYDRFYLRPRRRRPRPPPRGGDARRRLRRLLRRRARRRRPARRRRRLLRQGVPALPAHLGQLRPLPRRGGGAARRQEGALPQRRQRLPGLPRQPLPAHASRSRSTGSASATASRWPTSASSPPTCA